MKHLITTMLLLTAVNLSAQQFNIKGKVFDSSSGDPLFPANIVSNNPQTGTSTNEKGLFSLDINPSIVNYIKISYVGYESRIIYLNDLEKSVINQIALVSKPISSQSVLVKGTIGKKGETPVTFEKIERKEIEENYTIQDIPEYLSYLPSATFYSEGGSGLGYNYLRIRGFGQRRISVSINGIPQNEPEDHNVYWLDFPDLLAGTELIQVQRGAGSGITGYSAIGGSINIITSVFSDKPRVKFETALGSYHTRKYSAMYSSGLINEKYSIYAKLSHTMSSGYRDHNWIDFKSYHLAAVRYDENFTTQINFYGGPVADGLTYTGLPKFAIDDKELRRENYSFWTANDNYTYSLRRRPSEKENFSQPHFELLNEWNASENVTVNSALFLILGDGFFDYDASWADTTYFRLTMDNGFNPTANPVNALIRAKVENKQWGWIPRVNISHKNGELIIGGEMRFHNSVHWGSINYGSNLPDGLTKDYRYYYYEGAKDMLSVYAHEDYNVNERLSLLGEVQLNYKKYYLNNEKYIGTDFEIPHFFVQPRFGINYKMTPEISTYFTFARVSREPRLKTYYDAAESSGGAVPQFKKNPDGSYNFDEPLVSPETMNSFEAGLNYSNDRVESGVNLFYMVFDDEIVSQGQVDAFGQPITGNVNRTIHAGIELTGTFKINKYFDFHVNASYSKNYISSGKKFVYHDNGVAEVDLTDNRIAGFPDATVNGIFNFRYSSFRAQLLAKFVGDMRTDNYDNNLSQLIIKYPGITDYNDNLVESFFTANFNTSYEFELMPVFKTVKIYFEVQNIFDNLYASYGIGKEFFPGPERNFLGGIEVNL